MSDEDEENPSVQVSEMFLSSPWYADILYVLQHLSSPPRMPRNRSRTLKLKAAKCCILDSALFRKDPGGMLLNCLVEEEAKRVVEDFHRGDCEGQHRWILTATEYFTKWIEAIPTRQATDANISLGHSTAYYPQGNGLAESSNKSLVNIIKKLLEISKKGWHKKLINALWADRVSQKKSIGMSPFELVYGTDMVFPTSLVVLVVKLLQEEGSEDDPMQRRINQMIHLQQTREEVFQNTCKLQERIKKIYDRKEKADTFQLDEVVLRWDARHEDKGKHGKFENLCKGPYKVAAYRGQNAFLLKEMKGDECPGGSINGRLLKRYYF
eukprot:PITA_12708